MKQKTQHSQTDWYPAVIKPDLTVSIRDPMTYGLNFSLYVYFVKSNPHTTDVPNVFSAFQLYLYHVEVHTD